MKTVDHHKKDMDAAAVKDIRHARSIMQHYFDEDSGPGSFKDSYIANVAMLLHDRYGITDPRTRNNAAEDIIDLIFYDKR
jgi:hypothetical protein